VFPKDRFFLVGLIFDAELRTSGNTASLKSWALSELIALLGRIIMLYFISCFNSCSHSISCAAFSLLPEVKILSTPKSMNSSKAFF